MLMAGLVGLVLAACGASDATMAPTGTPAEAVNRVNAAMKAMAEDPAVLNRFRQGGIIAMSESPAQFNARIRADHEKYGKIIKNAGIKIE